LKFYYCNINMPPQFNQNVLDYIDLDIDLLVQKNLTFEILDLDEFQDNAKRFQYSDELKIRIQHGLEELLEMVKIRSFPFDYQDD
jgi:uncharacterized protein